MNATTLVSKHMIPLRTSDTGTEALGIMNDMHIKHLPIVNDKQLLGVISEDDILHENIDEPVGSYTLSMHRPYVNQNDHIYEVLRVLAEYQLSVIPVVDENDNYVGLITQDELLQFFARSGSFTEPGSILVLEMNKRDYSLSKIAQIVESENASIISSFVTTSMKTQRIDVTIKIANQHIAGIVATLERFEYTIKASYQESDYFEALQDRYDSLMSYLNV